MPHLRLLVYNIRYATGTGPAFHLPLPGAGYLRSSGFVTWLVWAALHVLALPQLQNRFRVQTQWFWSYLSGQRSSRLISEGPRSSGS